MVGTLGRVSRVGLWLSLTMVAVGAPVLAQQAGDNTKANKTHQLTADQQKSNRSDTTITRDIRRSIVSDKSLSTYAHNVKVITRRGEVTLVGPVRTDEEKQAIEATATQVAGAGHVKNNIVITPARSHARK